MHSRENATDRRTRARDRAEAAGAPRQRPELLGLQTTVGNAAVVQMLRRADRVPAEDTDVQRSTVPDVLRGPGRPLDDTTRTDMERRLGADFSDVRIHNDTAARASAAEIGARAYTSGNHVVIGDGGADPHTLAHELTHVIQQRSGPVAGTDHGDGLKVSDPSDRYERAAEAHATSVMSGTASPASSPLGASGHHRAGQAVQRMPPQRTTRSDASSSAPYDPPSRLMSAPSTGGLEGPAGYFERRRAWTVTPPQAGFIIQKITRRFYVQIHQEGTWVDLSPSEVDTYIARDDSKTYGDVLEYWELWTVNDDGTISDGNEDTFGLCSIIPPGHDDTSLANTSRGRYEITGRASFYPLRGAKVTPRQLGFTKTGAGRAVPAGGLYSAVANPTAKIQEKGLTPGAPDTYTVKVTWDTSSAHEDDHYSQVTN
ncbi:eCIS core domain-containing protein [Streptomyces microflavus]|uniref:eCIS core domain-containing protein n=1 Tax=Streptomyces microflavus TaxID=1919 RepID=UPI0038249F62